MTVSALRICEVCGLSIPDDQRSPLYCSKSCKRRAQRLRAARGPSCPACGKDNAILVNTAVGMVCADCAPYRSCGKLAYRSREAAEWAVTGFGLRAVQERDFAGHPAQPYECRHCGDWHLTTRGK